MSTPEPHQSAPTSEAVALFHAHVRGWRDGASGWSSRPAWSDNPSEPVRLEYLAGYELGRRAASDLITATSSRLSFAPDYLRAMIVQPYSPAEDPSLSHS